MHLVFALQPGVEQIGDEECEDLKAHARHLRATIAKLRSLPFRRLRTRIADLSLHAAVGAALTIHIATFVILVLTLCIADVRAAAHDLTGAGRGTLVWYPFDASYFLANGAGAALGMLLAPHSICCGGVVLPVNMRWNLPCSRRWPKRRPRRSRILGWPVA